MARNYMAVACAVVFASAMAWGEACGGRLLLQDAPGICTVDRELYQAHPEPGAAYNVQVLYTGLGLERAEVHSLERVSDEPEKPRVRWSPDNGRTWSSFEPLPDMVLREGEYKIYWGPGPRLYDPDAGVVVSIWLRQPYKDNTYINHCFSRFSRDYGRTWAAPKQLRYEEGPQFDPANTLDPEFLKYNRGYFGTNIIRHSNGTLIHCLTSVNVPYENADGKSYHPWVGADAKDIGALCMMGKWNQAANDYDWTAGKPVWVPLSVSSRGLMEPFVTELKDGRVLVVWRGSDTPETPGRKWFSISTDAGMKLSPVAEWTYAGGPRFYSPSSIHQFIRHSVSGKLYWVGNICLEPPHANHPRHPLVIGEVDEDRAAIKPETVTIIDDRNPGEGPEVQLSNFSLLENRETHELEMYLTKFGAVPSNVFTADCYRYEVKIK